MTRVTRKLLVLAFLLFSWSASAQEDSGDPEERASAFRAVSGPQVEQVPGGALLIGAYGVAWIAILGFFAHVGRLNARTATDIARLERAVAQQRES